MKRDFDLIREILLFVEENHEGSSFEFKNSYIENCSRAEFSYHCALLLDEGLLYGQIDKTMGNLLGYFHCNGLTWKGQDYLANIKNDTVWNKVKQTALEKGIDLTLDIIAKLAAKYTKKMIEE